MGAAFDQCRYRSSGTTTDLSNKRLGAADVGIEPYHKHYTIPPLPKLTVSYYEIGIVPEPDFPALVLLSFR